MTTVKVLLKGYLTEDNNNRTSATITLIQSKNINIVVDPGILKNKQLLIDALEKENLCINDINWVFITHSHMDHYANLGMFPNAKYLDYWSIWENDTFRDWNPNFTDDIEIIKTPGHCYDGISFLVKTRKGLVAIVGDVFWKKDWPIDDPYATDKFKLAESRKLIKGRADFIIPGHDDIYQVENKI
jgi:glyoxylase-like metal-dependent hydrolase (beta-lactamase superfamily II)